MKLGNDSTTTKKITEHKTSTQYGEVYDLQVEMTIR